MKKFVAALSSILLMAGIPTTSLAATPSQPSEQRVMVVFKDKADSTIISKAKGRVHHTFKNVPALAVTLPTSQLASLKSNPNIKVIEPDTVVKVKSQTLDWGVNKILAPNAWSSGYTGKGVNVAVVDSGIAPHSDLVVAGGVSFVSYTTSYADDNGHGTHVAGIIGARNNTTGVVGVAPDANLYAVKVLGSDGSGYLSDVVSGIDWAINNHMDVVNLSLGSTTDSYTLHQEVDKAYNSGVLVVAAGGNDGGTNTVEYPAKYDSTIAVSAVDSNNQIASFSSTGPEIEVSAPGVSILSTYLNNGYATMSGTSMATPFVAGELALLKQADPTATNVTLRSKLDQNILDLGAAGRDSLYGYGLIQSNMGTTQPAPTPAVSLTTATKVITDKTIYTAGQTVTITVNATDQNSQPLSGATVNVTITPPKGSAVKGVATTNLTGQAVFKLSTSSRSVKGTYQVTANTTLTNYKSSSAATTFQLK
ncbi:MAG TPA: S8 family serine peptidase [Bacillota bacterium]|nr:S8 family serine peptidase [Bacillota bacterium]